MMSHISRCRLAGYIAIIVAVVWTTSAHATFHLWQVNEIYSNASGSVQFIELNSLGLGQEHFEGPPAVQLISDNGGTPNVYTFTSDSSAPTTAGKKLLIATPDFNLVAGVTPDFVIPTQFLFTSGGTLTLTDTLNGGFQTAFVFNYTGLPLDGTNSLSGSLTTAVNSPTNFAGQTGLVPEPGSVMTLMGLTWLLIKRRRLSA